ncbi:MAG: NAD(P)H-dependent oxidoreductase, partial [Lachnospiraceae bacterium]|nr:NAD(P)H-dependent oxidoreductase [Lachnospiraceae bacterium]
DEADVIILASPVYVYHVTGAMKAFLDHYGYRWMVHRPEGAMFKKQGVAVATAAGAGMKSTVQDMADSLFFWGTAKTYRLGLAVAATNWDGVGKSKKKRIEKKTSALAGKIVKRNGMIKPSLKTRMFFFGMHLFQRKGFMEADKKYWAAKGWTKRVRPWK